MRFVMMLAGVLLVMSALAFAADEKPRCAYCGMFYDNSPTQVSAVFDVDGKDQTVLFESLGCLANYVRDNTTEDGAPEYSKLMVLDYTTFGTDKPVMIKAEDASYLSGTKRIKGSMAPFIAAFADDNAALKSIDALGGEVVDFAEVSEALFGAEKSGCGGNCAGCSGCPMAGGGE